MKVSFVGPSGAGKTTSATLLNKLIPNSIICSIATPLHEMQREFYKRLRLPDPVLHNSQDGEMLIGIRDLFFLRNENFLSDEFVSIVTNSQDVNTIINDDCRWGMYPQLKNMDFQFIWVERQHFKERKDISKPKSSKNPHDLIIPKEHCTATINNDGDLSRLVNNLNEIISILKKE